MDEGFFKRVMSQVSCASCGRRYEADDVHVLGHEEQTWFLRLVCGGCRSTGLVAALVNDEGKPPEIVTDLSAKELARLRELTPVSSDDVQSVRKALDDFRGDISKLFPSE
ncbi:MAG: hypothetical protein AAB502_02540 [Chloroflexota bacterium]